MDAALIQDFSTDEIDSNSIIEQHSKNIEGLSQDGAERYINAIKQDIILALNPPSNVQLFEDANFETLHNTFGNNIIKNLLKPLQ